MIRKLHHNAYRCRDSERTRAFYEDFLGLPLVGTLEIGETKTGRKTSVLHTFYRLDDGSHLAFFEAPDMPFEFKDQHDFDLHIALEVARGARRARADDGQGKGERHRNARHLEPRLHRLDLLLRSERLRDRTVRQARAARRGDGPGAQRRARDQPGPGRFAAASLRQAVGARPVARLNARLKAATDS